MARKAMIAAWKRTPKHSVQHRNRCRICFRDLALRGELPGITKSSW